MGIERDREKKKAEVKDVKQCEGRSLGEETATVPVP